MDDIKKLLGDEFVEKFSGNADIEEKGAWMPVPGKPGWRVRVRSQHSLKWRNFVLKQQKKHVGTYAAGGTPSAQEIDLDQIEQIVEVGITEWEGFNGLAFSKDTLRQIVEGFPVYRSSVLMFAADRSNYPANVTKEIAGN
jgi:hypothetical protein